MTMMTIKGNIFDDDDDDYDDDDNNDGDDEGDKWL